MCLGKWQAGGVVVKGVWQSPRHYFEFRSLSFPFFPNPPEPSYSITTTAATMLGLLPVVFIVDIDKLSAQKLCSLELSEHSWNQSEFRSEVSLYFTVCVAVFFLRWWATSATRVVDFGGLPAQQSVCRYPLPYIPSQLHMPKLTCPGVSTNGAKAHAPDQHVFGLWSWVSWSALQIKFIVKQVVKILARKSVWVLHVGMKSSLLQL